MVIHGVFSRHNSTNLALARTGVRTFASAHLAPIYRPLSVAEWLSCWTQAQKARVQIAVATLSGYSLGQTAHTHRAAVHQAVKLVAAS